MFQLKAKLVHSADSKISRYYYTNSWSATLLFHMLLLTKPFIVDAVQVEKVRQSREGDLTAGLGTRSSWLEISLFSSAFSASALLLTLQQLEVHAAHVPSPITLFLIWYDESLIKSK